MGTLTDEFIKSLKPTPGKQVEYQDSKPTNLSIRVSPGGKKAWVLRYRNAVHEQKRFTFGTYPVIGLAEARKLALRYLNSIQQGGDPAKEKREKKAKLQTPQVATVADLATMYFEACRSGRHKPNGKPKQESTMELETDHFNRLAKPKFGSTAIEDLRRAPIQQLIDTIGRETPGSARICRNVLHQMYEFAVRRELAHNNPVSFVDVPKTPSRERVLTEAELRLTWNACVNPSSELHLSTGMSLAIRLLIVTLQRGKEVTGASTAEINFETGIWTIPGDRTKNGKTHVVPLSQLALQLIGEALSYSDWRKTDTRGRYLFPSPRDSNSPITRHALTRAVQRINSVLGIEDARAHDFRRTGTTILTSEKSGIPRFFVSQALNHMSDTGGASSVTAIYDRNSYLPEKRRTLNEWAERVREIVES